MAVRPVTLGPAKIAIIIDDLGYSDAQATPFIQAPFPIAISVLPQLRYSGWVSREAAKAGKPVLLHLPLEAPKYYNQFLGPGALLLSMKDDDLKQTFETDLASVPNAGGMNNHMGSVGSRDPRITELVVEEAKAHHLFIVDSLTAPNSILYRQARKKGVPVTERDVFLDNEVDVKDIAIQFENLLAVALENGNAVAIGHPHAETLKVLLLRVPKLDAQKFQVVPITELLK